MSITHGTFHPAVDTELTLGRETYRICEHPVVRGQAFVQEGRAGKVFQLTNGTNKIALKVFHPPYRDPSLVEIAEALRSLTNVPGLKVAAFEVLHSRNHPDLVDRYPDLVYAMVMPWIDGPTWTETVMLGNEIASERCLTLALALVDSLVMMEQRKIAHADLSGANLILPALHAKSASYPIELVDVEGMFTSQRNRPDLVAAGSPGYSHFLSSAPNAWGPRADRFAGAILVCEMLSWWDADIRAARAGETYFEPFSTQQDRDRADQMEASLRERWGEKVAGCFHRAFESPSLDLCPVFEEWRVALLDAGRFQTPRAAAPTARETRAQVQAQMDRARRLYEQRRLSEARQLYEAILHEEGLPAGLAAEIPLIIEDLDAELAQKQREERSPEPSYIQPEQSPIRPVFDRPPQAAGKYHPSRGFLAGLAAVALGGVGFGVLTRPAPMAAAPEDPAPGVVKLQVQPDPVELTIDGIPFAEPLRGGTEVRLPEGKHRLEFQAQHYAPAALFVYVQPGQTRSLEAKLQPNVGNLTIETQPPGAKIWLDGKAQPSVSPFQVNYLAPGAHQIRVTLKDYKEARKEGMVAIGSTSSIRFELVKKPKPKPVVRPVEVTPDPGPWPAPGPAPAPAPAPAPGPGPIWH